MLQWLGGFLLNLKDASVSKGLIELIQIHRLPSLFSLVVWRRGCLLGLEQDINILVCIVQEQSDCTSTDE